MPTLADLGRFEAGVDLKTLQMVMGHAHLSITTDLYGALARTRVNKIADITRAAASARPPV